MDELPIKEAVEQAIIRETNNGVKSVYLDLANPNLMASEYFYLKPNDVIYVEAVKAKAFSVNNRALSISISSISVAVVVINLILSQTGN